MCNRQRKVVGVLRRGSRRTYSKHSLSLTTLSPVIGVSPEPYGACREISNTAGVLYSHALRKTKKSRRSFTTGIAPHVFGIPYTLNPFRDLVKKERKKHSLSLTTLSPVIGVSPEPYGACREISNTAGVLYSHALRKDKHLRSFSWNSPSLLVRYFKEFLYAINVDDDEMKTDSKDA
uniref:Uncharacterized protein n=1 Tax=Helianthus annuus TaxID=4232 RepID=A0A251SWI9_HELAN